MALTRAQLLMGDATQGTVITGQSQGVRPGGAGITIRLDGVIEVNPLTVVGLMKLGQTLPDATDAFNGYTWPTSAGSPGQQLETDGAGGLLWADSDGIDWTGKGQLIVGTGVDTDALLDPGVTTSFLVSDPLSALGLTYTDQITTAVLIPRGDTTERPSVATAGNFRWNTTLQKLEVFNGISWYQIPASDVYDFVFQTRPVTGETASAIIPSGATSQRTVSPSGGYLRYNSTENYLEFYNGTAWELVSPSAGGVHSFVQSATPTAFNTGDIWYDTVARRESVWSGTAWVQPGVTQTGPTGAASIPIGNSTARPTGVDGYFRVNTSIGAPEYYLNSQWNSMANPVPTGSTMLFYQATAPTGWTQVTTAALNNSSLRIVTSAGGSTAGSLDFTTAFASRAISGTVSGSNSGGAVASTTVTGSVSGSNSGGSIGSTTVTGSVSGSNTGGSIGSTAVTGSVSGSNSGGAVSATSLSVAQLPAHDHQFQGARTTNTRITTSAPPNDQIMANIQNWGAPVSPSGTITVAIRQVTTNTNGSGSSHTHGFTNPSWSGSFSSPQHSHSFSNPSWSGSLSTNAHSHTFGNPSWSGSISLNSHSHSFTQPSWSGSVSIGNLNMAVKYADVIICTKS